MTREPGGGSAGQGVDRGVDGEHRYPPAPQTRAGEDGIDLGERAGEQLLVHRS
ncbi:MAG TPA: hypothetical protein VN880_11865 [Solirubrobacteraceae bacterium]|jgi:hypothetical protein|nr:hypothetical protein [Solirubrobacteraceae bacterium]